MKSSLPVQSVAESLECLLQEFNQQVMRETKVHLNHHKALQRKEEQRVRGSTTEERDKRRRRGGGGGGGGIKKIQSVIGLVGLLKCPSKGFKVNEGTVFNVKGKYKGTEVVRYNGMPLILCNI